MGRTVTRGLPGLYVRSTAAGAAPRSANQTPLEDALGEQGWEERSMNTYVRQAYNEVHMARPGNRSNQNGGWTFVLEFRPI